MSKNLITSKAVRGLVPAEASPSAIKLVVGEPPRMRVGDLVTDAIIHMAEIRYKQRQKSHKGAKRG